MIKKALPFAISLIITGCISVPDITNSTIESTKYSQDNHVSAYSLKSEYWWQEINDKNLNQLMTIVLANNKDLKLIDINLQKLQEQYNLNNSYKYSTLNLNAKAEKERLSANSFNPPEYSRKIIDMDSLSLSSTYDFDLFNKTEHLGNKYLLIKEAEQLNKQWATLSLSNQVVKFYMQYNYLIEDRLLLIKQKDIYSTLLELEKYKLNIGKSIPDNVWAIENDISNLNTIIADNEAKINLTSNSILILSNNNPLTKVILKKQKKEQFKNDLKVPSYYNSSIIVERPDVKYYLLYIRSQKEELSALKSDFYPSFTISGNLGFESIKPNLLFSKSSLFANLSPALNLPIFDAGRIKSNYKLAGLDLDTFIENYNLTLSNAVKNINDNLYQLKQKDSDFITSNNKLKNDISLYGNMEERYKLGKISKYDLLSEKLKIVSSERNNNQVVLNRFSQKIDLINSLGGINIKNGE